jgi:muconolactone delta-isomerase
MEYENAQKRILEVFTQWKAPGNFKIELFVIRVGDWGGYMLLDCDDPTAVHKFCSMLPAFVFEARPVIPIDDAVRVELEAIAFRDELKRKWYVDTGAMSALPQKRTSDGKLPMSAKCH